MIESVSNFKKELRKVKHINAEQLIIAKQDHDAALLELKERVKAKETKANTNPLL